MKNDEIPSIVGGKVVYANVRTTFKSILDRVVHEEGVNMYSIHKEADSGTLFYVASVPAHANISLCIFL